MTFTALLQRALEAVGGSQAALARALGLSRPRVNRALRGDGYPFGLEACLSLAELCGEHPDVVLTAAGKSKIAARLNRLYNATERTKAQQLVLADLDVLSPAVRRNFIAHLHDLAAESRRRQASDRTAPRRRKSVS